MQWGILTVIRTIKPPLLTVVYFRPEYWELRYCRHGLGTFGRLLFETFTHPDEVKRS